MIGGKIGLGAMVVLFFVVVIVFSLHLYARWFLLRARRFLLRARRPQLRSRRGYIAAWTSFVSYVLPDNNPATSVARGLQAWVLKSLPVFTYSTKTHQDSVLDCAVCLWKFEENESGRILPKCNHSFHTECIDRWFPSHSTCPLCRTPVEEYDPAPANPADVAFTIHEPTGVESGPVSGPGLCVTCQHENEQIGTSSFGGRVKLSVEIPRRNGEGFEGESSACESATSESSYRSPMSRMLSFKRILSRERRQSPCASPRTVTVIDSDTGRGESQV